MAKRPPILELEQSASVFQGKLCTRRGMPAVTLGYLQDKSLKL